LLGRDLSAGANANIAVNLIQPGVEWADRVNEIDIRIAQDRSLRSDAHDLPSGCGASLYTAN
jgi:hypothetical protein